MADGPAEGTDRQALITVLTTEHFTLQGARSSKNEANAEVRFPAEPSGPSS